ncbi:MAG: aromatic ring-hydroxylating dioxygenase subunit alpha [Alphaproteobacteria bacterium]|nr:aromatic ring-hydroxylating dioxygenase subunit alpha [Alphaproteobacteria bacterium]
MIDAAEAKRLEALFATYRPGRGLERELYTDPGVYQADFERIFRRHWLFAGTGCMIPNKGDFHTWRIGSDTVLLVRGEDGQVRAFHNTCRHRGMQVCAAEQGRAQRLMCRYHGWTYGLDGRLMKDTAKEFGVGREELGLKPIKLVEAADLLFVSFAENPPDFSGALADIRPKLGHHRLDRAKVAKAVSYDVRANWKIVWENNRECYHCPTCHPDYTKATLDVPRFEPKRMAEVARVTKAANDRFAALGLDQGDQYSLMSGAFWRVHRAPMAEGWITQSIDGKPVSTLMGDLKERSFGTLRMSIFPNFWQHVSDDHAVATRITPVAADRCRIDVWWLVDRDAVEGKDYTLDRLLPFWKDVSEQDWQICEDVQAGISSSSYEPGPFSKVQETNVAHYLDWYIGEMTAKPPARRLKRVK